MELWTLCMMILLISFIHIGQAPESPKAVVTIKPDKHVFRGETVTLRCEIQGGGDTKWIYSWNKYDQIYRDHKTQEFSFRSVRNEHSGKYTCSGRRRSDYQSSEISDAVTLTVSEKPKPELTSDLKGAALTGNPVTLSCTLKLQSAGWKFYWIKPTQSSETKTHQYIISPVRVSDGGQYRCIALRGNPVYYTDYSDELWVNVTERPKAVVTIKPDKHVFRGETVTLRCEIQGGGDTEWIYRWFKDDQIYQDLKTQEFSFSSVRNEHSGKYTCRGRRRSDSQSSKISDAVTLTVSDGDMILDSPVHPVTEGHNLTLRCLFHNKTIPSSGVDFYKDDSILHSQTTGEMTISSVSKSDEGFYHCKHPERGESPKSWVSVRGASMSVLKLISSLVTVSVYLLLTIILAVKCFRARVQTDEDTQNAVIEE